jgi:Protein of unknown function (DUF2939)
MRWGVVITVAVLVALGFYIASPLIALYRISSAVEAKDAVALAERIDFNAVKKSFRKQIWVAYRELTGKPAPLDAMARRFAGSVADPLVARLVTVRALLELLGEGKIEANGKVVHTRVPIDRSSLDSVWRLWLNSDYLGRDFYIYLPPDAQRTEQFQVHLRPIKWRWTVVGVYLPEELRKRLARELLELVRGSSAAESEE